MAVPNRPDTDRLLDLLETFEGGIATLTHKGAAAAFVKKRAPQFDGR